jgi:hypothetical protein
MALTIPVIIKFTFIKLPHATPPPFKARLIYTLHGLDSEI